MERYNINSAADRFDRAYAEVFDPSDPLKSMHRLKVLVHDLYLTDIKNIDALIESAQDPLEREVLTYCKEIEKAEYESFEILRATMEAEDLAKSVGLESPKTSFHYKMAEKLSETANKYRTILDELYAMADDPDQLGAVGGVVSPITLADLLEKYPPKVREAFAVLKLSPPVTLKNVKARYRKLAKQLHPDASGKKKESKEFIRLNSAYNVVCEFLKNGR